MVVDCCRNNTRYCRFYMMLNGSYPRYDNSQIERYASKSQGASMYKESDNDDQFDEAVIKRSFPN